MEENEKLKNILTDCLVEFRDNMDLLYIRADLIQRRVFTFEQIKDIETSVRSRSSENLLMDLIGNKPWHIKTFLEILERDYKFLVNTFYSKFDKKYGIVHNQRKLNIFTDYRKEKSLPLRHKLKLLSHRGEISGFNSIVASWEEKWELSLKERSISTEEKMHLADMYFMTLDAQLEHRRVICDRDLVNDELLFTKVKNIGAMTSEPYLSYMMYLARYGSAKRLAGLPFDDGIQEVEEALSRFDLIPACRETGIVLYIYFNMISSNYEKDLSKSERNRLLELAGKAIDHFGREGEKMGEDFKRMVLTKIALVNLGIGVFGNHLNDVCVTEENRRKAGDILNKMQTEYWNQLEGRWKMFYYIAKSKVCELEDDLPNALTCTAKALKFSSEGKFIGEGENIKKHCHRLSFQWKIFLLRKYSCSILLACCYFTFFIFSIVLILTVCLIFSGIGIVHWCCVFS